MSGKPILGITVGGGPAPGINGVISAATIEARNNGLDVIGFYDGFAHLSKGDGSQCRNLDIDTVSRIHLQGGSILRTSRVNPTKDPAKLANVVKTLQDKNIRYFMTIGGDDTAFSSSSVEKAAAGKISVVHVPKTIDNDLPLPPTIPTFGYQTARHVGVDIVQNLMADATTSPRWYIVVAMGRKAGHLALGIGKAAAVPITLIPEEFGDKPVVFSEICDMIEGAVLKRRALGRDFGVAVLAEGLAELMTNEHREEIFGNADVDRDEHGHIKLDDIPLGNQVRNELRRRFRARGDKMTFISKNLGYELRCADPIPYDREYTRDLGYGAVRFLLSGQSGAVVTFDGGKLNPLKFNDEKLRDPVTNRFRVRMVDTAGEAYEVAKKYMIRLEASDLQNQERLGQMADAAKMSVPEFLAKFRQYMK